MKRSYLFIMLALSISFSNLAFSQQDLDPVSKYYNQLKESKLKGGAETAYLSIGSDMLYALEYFEAKNYSAASWSFNAVLKKDPENAYANFLYGASLAKLGNGKDAKPYLEKAAEIMPSLSDLVNTQLNTLVVEKPVSLFEEDKVKNKQKDKEVSTTVNPKPGVANVKPGAVVKPAAPNAVANLVFGSYACDYQQYQGNVKSGRAYKSIYKGYFLLKPDGTYRWLDNGGTGKYSYDAKTGKLTWLSGYMKNLSPVSTIFKDGKKVAQIDVKFDDNYSWECGCNK